MCTCVHLGLPACLFRPHFTLSLSVFVSLSVSLSVALSLFLCPSVPLSLFLCPSGLTLVYWCASCVSNGYKIVFAPGTLSALCKVKCNKHYEKSHHSLHRFNPILTLCLSLSLIVAALPLLVLLLSEIRNESTMILHSNISS